MYQGNSIVDYLNSVGQKSDYATRAGIAASHGITGYSGTAAQNTQLLNMLRGGGSQVVSPNTQAPVVQSPPTQQPKQQTQPATQATAQQTGPTTASQLVSMGFPGYAGWGNAEAVADYNATGGSGKGGQTSTGSIPTAGAGAGISGGTGFLNAPTINLPELYNSLYANSGIKDIENKLSTMTSSYNEAVAKIKDNPYLSEATMTGRLRKLDDKFNADTQAIRGEVATRKADIETQLNLQTKQFDINSEQAKLALSQFNALLDSGALNNASGEDIANITRATGLSSGIILSAIDAKIKSGYTIESKSFDDGVSEGFIVYTLDPAGNIVNQQKQVTGKSSKSNAGQYSTDPIVSAFVSKFLNQNGNISDLWGNEEDTTTGNTTQNTTQNTSSNTEDFNLKKAVSSGGLTLGSRFNSGGLTF